MIIWSEVRGVIAVAATIAAIIALFAYIPTLGDDENFYDETSATTIAPIPTTTVDAPLLTGLVAVGDLCDLAQQFADGASSDLYQFPGKVQQLAQEFYDMAYDLSVGDVRAEYLAARDYYQDYNRVAGPGNYDALTILRGADAARFRQLATREPPGVEDTRANIAFLCGGLEIPGPPRISQGEFERLEEIVEDEQGG